MEADLNFLHIAREMSSRARNATLGLAVIYFSVATEADFNRGIVAGLLEASATASILHAATLACDNRLSQE